MSSPLASFKSIPTYLPTQLPVLASSLLEKPIKSNLFFLQCSWV